MNPLYQPLGFKRFSIVALLTFTLVFSAVWLWVVKEPLAYSDKEYAMWLAKMEMLDSGNFGRLLILGDSRPVAGLIPARIGDGVVNLAFGGGNPIDVYYTAQKIVQSPHPPQAILLSFSPDHFINDDVFWSRSVEFGFLNFKQVNEIREKSREFHEDTLFGPPSPFDIDARLKSFLYAIKFPTYYFPSLFKGRIFRRYGTNKQMLNLILSTRGQGYFGVANGSIGIDSEAGFTSFIPSKVMDDYFDRTLALFQTHHLPVYFVGMPHNQASVHNYWTGLKGAFVAYLNQYAARYPDFHLLGDPMPTYPSEDFGDSSHLNSTGAPLWSDTVRQLLNDSHVEGGPFEPSKK